jgi:hypothetical protein
MATSNENVFVVDWPKKLAVWLGLTTLLPMVAYFGAAALFAPPDEDAYNHAIEPLHDQLNAAAPADKPAVQAKLDRLEKEHRDALREFARRLFWTCYGAGLLAVNIGLFIPVRAVGAGLMFGGIIAVGSGCYDSWDQLGRWLRFGALLFALIVFAVLSLVRFWRPQPAPVSGA